ncbi:hypothetical protein PUN28_016457 [Cardiocondyla obscurior]|uniref:Uncharacterized protein n=1 Tax=Cardiocondyla obscurior TaxID=286306 RepID=A0AAW2EPH1_9HYME
MASQEPGPSQPDTQNADGILTQSQDTPSQQSTLVAWGRLVSARRNLRSVDLVRDISYSCGRSMSCDISVTLNDVDNNSSLLNVLSKVHFCIYKERIENDIVVYLEDKSHNGTYVDANLVGRGNRVIIGHNSKIHLARVNRMFYTFTSINLRDSICELPVALQQKYAIGRKLGAGACGEVRLLFTKNGSETFAMKIIRKNYFSSGDGNILNNPANIRNEVEILKRLKHPCIINLVDIYDTADFMYIILELMKGGELFDRIRQKGKLSESSAKLIFYQVVLAVYYLHKEGITHRDLKPENILLKDDTDKPLVKVSDFGMSKFVDAHTMMRTFCGTPMYVAPEILETLGRSSYTSQVDVWSLGVILYVCLSGTTPFKNTALEQDIRTGQYDFRSSNFRHVSQEAIDLIKRMMTVNPRTRITVPQIICHSWLRDKDMRNEVYRLIRNENVENIENDENIPPSNICVKRPRLY